MKSLLLSVSLSFLYLISAAQINYEPGYFITSDNEKVNCLIKNLGWQENPNGFKYKMNESGEPEQAVKEKIKAFSVPGKFLYEKHTVQIDMSSGIDEYFEPQFEERTLFLNVLVKGEATLYSFNENTLNRYFLSINQEKPEQLVFKRYMKNTYQYSYNKTYIHQLWENLQCKSIGLQDVQHTDYTQKDLVSIFFRYNQCASADYTSYSQENKAAKLNSFHLRVLPEYRIISLDFNNPVAFHQVYSFDNQQLFSVGLEAEYILPFYRNKVSALSAATYQQVNAMAANEYGEAKLDYQSIELTLAGRYYFYMNDFLKIYLTLGFQLDNPLSNSSFTARYLKPFKILLAANPYAEAGMDLNEDFRIGLKTGINRDLMSSYINWTGNYSYLSLSIGYRIF